MSEFSPSLGGFIRDWAAISAKCKIITKMQLLPNKCRRGVNPFAAPACKTSGLKDAWTCLRKLLQTVYFLVLYHSLLSMLCVLINPLRSSPEKKKKKRKKFKGFRFRILCWSFPSDVTAVKGLKQCRGPVVIHTYVLFFIRFLTTDTLCSALCVVRPPLSCSSLRYPWSQPLPSCRSHQTLPGNATPMYLHAASSSRA